MKRGIDIALALAAMVVLLLPFCALILLLKCSTRGPLLHWSARVGRHNKVFLMPKLRTMRIDTPQVASELLADPAQFLTPFGAFLRQFSLDEVPQLWSIVRGDMSLVGPRPALFNQHQLIALRTDCGVHHVRPGLTGWAQINGRDTLALVDKVRLDRDYIDRQSLLFDMNVMLLTVLAVARRDGVRH